MVILFVSINVWFVPSLDLVTAPVIDKLLLLAGNTKTYTIITMNNLYLSITPTFRVMLLYKSV